MLIKCKHLEHATEKDMVDPRTHMVHVIHQWNKIGKELQKFHSHEGAKKMKQCARIPY